MSEQRYNGTIVSGRKDCKLANSDNIFDKDRRKMQSDINKEMKTLTDKSFASLKQTKQSAEDGGENVITLTRHDGTSEQVKFYNGSKGDKGDKGDKGEVGMQGNSGVADASNKTLVNDAITGGESDFLSAEVGKLGILTYDCSKGGSVTHATLQDAINSVPTTFQKVGLTITYKSGNTIYRYTLKENEWSADPANWFSVEDKLSDLSNEVGRIQQNIYGLDKTITISEFKIGWNEISSFAAIANANYNIIISLDVAISGGVYVRIKENEAVKHIFEINGTKKIISFVCDKPSNISIEYNKYAIDLSNNSMLTNIKCNATIPTMSEFNDNIDSIKSKIEYVNNTTVDKTGGNYTLTSIESKFEGKYISLDGKVYASAPYFISNSITLHKDDKIEAHINVVNDNVVSVISKRIAEDSYEVLSIGHIDQEVYTFVATEDCEVVLCYKTISSIAIDRVGTINRKINDLSAKTHHILHVGKDEEYKTISSACSDAINGDVIIVHEGTYNESVNISACDTTEDHKTVQNLSHFRDIAIIGVDKEKCILQNDLGLYASPPLWMTNGLLKNMTIKSLHTNNTKNNISYAIHIDGAIYSNGCKTPLTIDNCIVYSENNNTLGCGIDDVDIIVTNSEIQSTTLGTYPMAVHNSAHCRANGSKVKLKNNIFIGSFRTCLWFNKVSITSEEDKFEVLAIGNILHSNYEYKESDLTRNDNDVANMSELNAFNRGSLILGE